MTTNGIEYDEKAVDPEAIRRSVVDSPKVTNAVPSNAYDSSIFWFSLPSSDEFVSWGTNVKERDKQLRNFLMTEPIFASSLGIICSRNASFSWSLEGPESDVKKYKEIFDNANNGLGWVDLMMKVSVDLYTQDNAAFIETVRIDNSEDAEIVGLNHLDSARCYHTGDPENPVIYQDRKGKYHVLKWYQVITLAEMPTGIEGRYGLQYCALTRLLRAVEIMKSISIYDYERTSGQHSRAIHMLKGITATQVTDAVEQAKIRTQARGLQRYSQPVIVGSVDPKADVGHDTLELASLPDNMDRDSMYKWYLTQVAMAFFEDYQTFAPLPGGNLGSSSQSEILNAKARGKGSGLFQKLMAHAFNARVLPKNMEFQWNEQDLAQEMDVANVKLTRAQERAARIASFEITPAVARNLAFDVGDLPREIFDAFGDEDLTTDIRVQDVGSVEAQSGPPGKRGTIQAPKQPPVSPQPAPRVQARPPQ